jgi:hypothetical protein
MTSSAWMMRPPRAIDSPHVQASWRSRAATLAALSLGFFSFLPYPAIPAGNNSAIQIGTLITVLMLPPIFLMSWRRRLFYLYPLLLIPLCTSAVKVAITQQPGLDTCVKSLITEALPCLTMLAAMLYAPRRSLQIMTGIAAATILHVMVGCLQEYVFLTGGEFPLLFIYQNPSFLSVAEQARDIVLYIQRPFGLFPEPSAMSSSLAPWILIWIAEMCGLLRFAARPARWQRILFKFAAFSGLALIISSRSGHAMATLAAVLVLGVAWIVRARATPRNFLVMVGVFGVVLPLVVWLTVLALGDRVVDSTGMNQSWQDRSESLVVGFRLWALGDHATILFGIGSGLSAAVLNNNYALDAVWSVLLTYLYETGVIGGLVLTWFGVVFVRVWRATGFSIVFAAVLLVWLVGVTLTTSYSQLLPIWMTLGFLLVWPQAFPTRFAKRNGSGGLPPTDDAELAEDVSAGEKTLSLTPWDRDVDPA